MFSLQVENNNGGKLDLTTSPNYTLYQVEGLTPPEATINQSVNTTMDGSVINSMRVESRNLVLYMTIEGNVEANRIELYKYFTPKKLCKICYQNEHRDVYIEGYVESFECGLFDQKQVAQISIICPKPYFKGVEEIVTSFSNIVDAFEFPFSIVEAGIEFSTTSKHTRKNIYNTGDVETGIKIELYATGAVTNPVVYDAINQTFLKLKMSMAAGDLITINTNQGEKSIKLLRNGEVSNAMGYMSPDSTWLTMAAGDNVFTYEASSGVNDLIITFSSPLLYGGV